MKKLFNQMSQRFPEIRDRIQDDADLPYLIMISLADWIGDMTSEQMTPELIDRVVAFTKWCEDEPRGTDAGDDLFTILVVGFYEKLFESDAGVVLLPKLISREDLVANADYWKTWVGEYDYNKALEQYDVDV